MFVFHWFLSVSFFHVVWVLGLPQHFGGSTEIADAGGYCVPSLGVSTPLARQPWDGWGKISRNWETRLETSTEEIPTHSKQNVFGIKWLLKLYWLKRKSGGVDLRYLHSYGWDLLIVCFVCWSCFMLINVYTGEITVSDLVICLRS